MKNLKLPIIGIVATVMFTGVISGANMPFANIAYAEEKNTDVEEKEQNAEEDDKKEEVETKTIKIEGKNIKVPVKGSAWIKVNGYYHFVKEGKLTKGWKRFTKKDGESIEHYSFFDLKNGRLYTGWRNMGKAEGEKTLHLSYFGANGWLRTGWQRMGTENNPDGKNAEHWSYFGANGWLRTGWKKLGTAANPDGKNAEHLSYFGSNGWMRTGWQKMGTAANPDGDNKVHWSYFGDNGWMRLGWQKMGTQENPDGENKAHWSHFGTNGWLLTSKWYTNKDGIRYFNANGWMVTGSNVIGNKLYDEVKKKNASGLLKRNDTVNGWYECKDKWYFMKKGEVRTAFNGVSQVRKKGTWYHVKNGVTNGAVKGTAILAHSSKDERGKYWNGQAGDQTKSETYFRTWYNRPWKYVLRPKDAKMSEKLVTAMTNAAYNEHIGYDMLQRKTLYMAAGKVGWDLSKVAKDVETDCSALVSTALVYAGLKPKDVLTSDGNLLYTSIMKDRLMATGKFTLYTSKEYISGPNKLQRGDILIMAPEGHTAVVVKSVSDLKDNK